MKNKNLQSEKSRRSFIKKTSTIACGLLAVPLPIKVMANVYGNNKLNSGLI